MVGAGRSVRPAFALGRRPAFQGAKRLRLRKLVKPEPWAEARARGYCCALVQLPLTRRTDCTRSFGRLLTSLPMFALPEAEPLTPVPLVEPVAEPLVEPLVEPVVEPDVDPVVEPVEPMELPEPISLSTVPRTSTR